MEFICTLFMIETTFDVVLHVGVGAVLMVGGFYSFLDATR